MSILEDLVPSTYTQPLKQLITQMPRQELAPSLGSEKDKALLDNIKEIDLFADRPVTDQEMYKCCLSGLYLAYHFLDYSHEISQNLPSSTGSYWHAIMHRREPDYSNSAYWFRKVGEHPIFSSLPDAIQSTVAQASAPLQNLSRKWDPDAFNDICEAQANGGDEQSICEQIQQIEWCLLFNYAYAGATR